MNASAANLAGANRPNSTAANATGTILHFFAPKTAFPFQGIASSASVTATQHDAEPPARAVIGDIMHTSKVGDLPLFATVGAAVRCGLSQSAC
jgi:hypothetical protein